MGDLRHVLTTSVLEHSPYRRREIGYPEMESFIGGELERYPQVYVGEKHITIPSQRLKLVCYDAYPVPVGECAREYLNTVYADTRQPLRPRHGAPGFTWNPPAYCEPTRGTLAYVDIVACYWQILSVLRPDDIVLGDAVIEGSTQWLNTDDMEADRELRHAVVGSIFSSSLTCWRYGVERTVKMPARWANPSLRRYCMSVLHSICSRAVRKHGLVAWMTDAAILPASEAELFSDHLAMRWGLRSKVKAAGRGEVWSVTSYQVGQKRSRDVTNRNATFQPSPFSRIRRVRTQDLLSIRRKAWTP
jgi:hypothetical protein